MNRIPSRPSFVAACVVTLALSVSEAAAQSAVGLGTAGSYAVLAGSSVSNTGPTTINGDLGVSPGTALTGFPPGTINGSTHLADAAAAQAQADLTVAYDDAAGRSPGTMVSGDLGNRILAPGVYRSGSSIGLTGTLTLDGQNNPDSVFIIQVGSSLTTATGSRVALINGAQACNVFWQIGSSATLGSTTTFIGNLLVLTSITLNDGVTVDGRTLARNAAVTLINDTITTTQCAAGTDGGTTAPGGGSATGPDDGTAGGGSDGAGPEGAGPEGGGGTPTVAAPPELHRSRCLNRTFRARVSGRNIARVVFSVGGRVLGNEVWSPFAVVVRHATSSDLVTARVTFNDGRAARTLRMRFKACASARRPTDPARRPQTPPGFTG